MFYSLHFSLTNALILGLYTTVSSFSSQYQVWICKTYTLLQLRRFWNIFQIDLAIKGLYKASINNMRFRLQELQEANSKA